MQESFSCEPVNESSALKLEGLVCGVPPSLISSGSSTHIICVHHDLRSLTRERTMRFVCCRAAVRVDISSTKHVP